VPVRYAYHKQKKACVAPCYARLSVPRRQDSKLRPAEPHSLSWVHFVEHNPAKVVRITQHAPPTPGNATPRKSDSGRHLPGGIKPLPGTEGRTTEASTTPIHVGGPSGLASVDKRNGPSSLTLGGYPSFVASWTEHLTVRQVARMCKCPSGHVVVVGSAG
jgi:hypothetical protein